MLSPDRLITMAQTIRDVIVDYYAICGYELPDRRVIVSSPAQEMHGCGQFVVSCEGTTGYEGPPTDGVSLGHIREASHAMRSAVFSLTVARCSPEMDEAGRTDELDEEEVAGEIWADGVLMLNALVTAQKSGTLPNCGQIVFLNWDTTPQPADFDYSTLRVQIGLIQ